MVRGLVIMSFKDNFLCESCIKGKQVQSSFKRKKNDIYTQRPLELIHLDSFRLTRIEFISGKSYDLVNLKDEAFRFFCNFLKHV